MLKRLEIHGFKSFAEKVTLDFRQGLSVVVGPNGSGKSNISDAVRWVIGEQSAKSLRGAKMEDVIFAGSSKRRPVGMAEVSLTLDNSTGIFPLAYNEVTVTRRVFRSGESEYLINKNHCRLKDVQELFMDTGIGREGFSIIGQGRVEEILSSKPEDRRGMIEEVAGITKYRHRKREAARKLEDTEQNLVRLAGIVAELETQLDPLAEQADIARQFLKLKADLDEQELNLAVHDIEDLSAKLNACRSQIITLQDTIVQAEAKLGGLEASTADLKLSLQGLDEQVFLAQNHCHELAGQIQEKESEIKLCGEKATSIEAQQGRLDAEVAGLQRKIAGLQAEHAAEEAKLMILRQTRSELEQQLEIQELSLAEHNRELGSAEDSIEKLKVESLEVLAQTAKLNNELTALNQQEENSRFRLQALEKALQTKETELAETNNKLASGLAELTMVRDQIDSMLSALRAGKAELEEALTLRQAQEAEIAEFRSRLQALSSRLKILSDMQREYEGFHRGVREVLRAAANSTLEGVCGVVANLIEVPARLETAIETALGGNLQNIITESEEHAKQAVAFLKANKFGRATFLPLDALQPSGRNFEPEILQAPGVLGSAADLIGFDGKFSRAIEYLLGRILVVENLDLATKVAKMGNYKLLIVTLEGEFLSPGGSITGGSLQQKSTSILRRNREIVDLVEQEKSFSKTLEQLVKREQETGSNLAGLQRVQTGREQQLKELEVTLAACEVRRESLQQEEGRVKRQLEEIKLEAGQISPELDKITVRQKELALAINQSQSEYEQLNQRIASSQDGIKDRGSARELLMDGITKLKVKVASIEQEEKSTQISLERYFRQKAELHEGLEKCTQEIQSLNGRKQELAEEVSRLRENMAGLAEQERVSQAELLGLREQRQAAQANLTQLEEASKAQRKSIQQQQDLLHGSQVREARLDTEISNAFTRLKQDLGCELEQARMRSKPVANRRESAAYINKVKLEMAGLGPVNVRAVEDYDRMFDRYNFLVGQRQDLLQAKNSLFNVIAEIDKIMVERFNASFALIKENFKQVFEELFGGGLAELQLTEPENPLETGVEIIAQPPGKKLQHLSLLSGGEKALTAIALLFAMLKVKPSPFCVLDEIEAALDEANVNRFAVYLRELVSLNQFVVISHRKGTMEVADVLYGVTMEDTGVSKLYSVKMADEVVAG